jgi:type IV fimbrial biogenesis protein FimT
MSKAQVADGRASVGIRPDGFSLIELIVVVAVVAMLAAIAYPAFIRIINANRLNSQADELMTSLQFARSEAIRRNARVSVCGSANGTACGGAWTNVLTVVEADGTVLRSTDVKAPVQVSSAAGRVTYRADGLAVTAVNTTITACIPTTQPAENRRLITLTSVARVAITRVNGGGACP